MFYTYTLLTSKLFTSLAASSNKRKEHLQRNLQETKLDKIKEILKNPLQNIIKDNLFKSNIKTII